MGDHQRAHLETIDDGLEGKLQQHQTDISISQGIDPNSQFSNLPDSENEKYNLAKSRTSQPENSFHAYNHQSESRTHRFFSFIVDMVLFIPRTAASIISVFVLWFSLLFGHGSEKPNKHYSPLSNSLSPNVGISNNVDSASTQPCLDPTIPVIVTQQQQQNEVSVKIQSSNSILKTLLGWIPLFPKYQEIDNALLSTTSSENKKDLDDEVIRGLQSPYSTVTSSTSKLKPSSKQPSTTKDVKEKPTTSTPSPSDKNKTRHSRKSSGGSNSSRPKLRSGTSIISGADGPILESEADLSSSSQQQQPNTPRKRKSPLSYAFKVPRLYSPPRPLLPPQTYKPLSLWQLISWTLSPGPKNPNASGFSIGPNDSLVDTNANHTTFRSAALKSSPSLGSTSLRRPQQISTNVNAIHQRRLKKKTLVLDLDETLIHSLSRAPGFSQGQMVEVKLHTQYTTLYTVLKRPFCDEFLEAVSQWYNLVIFTASVQAYADPMIDWLERDRKYFVQRYYRQHCTQTPMGYVKNLGVVDTDLSNVLIIDNSPISYLRNESNGIGIEGWINDPSDSSLLALIPFLSAIRFTTDVRSILGLKSGDAAFIS